MGGSSSKPAPIEAPTFDPTKITAQLPDIEAYEDTVQSTLDSANKKLEDAVNSASKYQGWFKIVGYLFLAAIIAWVCWTYVYPWVMGMSHNPVLVVNKDLSITSATVGTTDVTRKVINRISKNELHIQVDSSVGASEGTNLEVHYQYVGKVPGSVSVPYGKPMDIVYPDSSPSSSSTPSSWWNRRNLLPAAKDAKIMSTIAVPDNGSNGDYGYEFWMYVTDWNYKFGQEKNILLRADATNSAILNPSVTLHPTDNTMKISVSIFPSTSNSSKAEPAPAGHSGSTDDVYVCEIPNIPLQTWVAVSVTVSTRNLDVYLNGKLVKSCFLSGVPKPVTGNVTLNNDGGFSGWMCGFYHHAKMLVPSDAQSFYNSGVPCRVPGTSSAYDVTFGFFDKKGKVVSNYVF